MATQVDFNGLKDRGVIAKQGNISEKYKQLLLPCEKSPTGHIIRSQLGVIFPNLASSAFASRIWSAKRQKRSYLLYGKHVIDKTFSRMHKHLIQITKNKCYRSKYKAFYCN